MSPQKAELQFHLQCFQGPSIITWYIILSHSWSTEVFWDVDTVRMSSAARDPSTSDLP